MVAADPHQGGATWAVLQYALGFRRLGHKVQIIEKVPWPSGEQKAYFESVMRRFDLSGELTTEVDRLQGYDLVLNISGRLPADTIASIPTRVYLDLDPAFNQLWHAEGIDRGLDGHTHFVTVGQSIGREGCDVPTLGRSWIPSRPPVVLDQWPSVKDIETPALTTVGNLRAYGPIERNGVLYGQKVHSLRHLMALPRRTGQRFILAMHLHPDEHKDIAALEAGGWEFVDPTAVAGTPDMYRRFLGGSQAEIGIAKSGYVVSRCGWFSDRSACYLASGRPVVAQETGFSRFLPTGVGLFAFDDEDGAVSAIEQLRTDYTRNSLAAREIAFEYFNSDRVLTEMLERVAA
jgi:hypothetical protein